MIAEAVPTLAVVLVMLASLAALRRRFDRREMAFLQLSVAAHIVSVFAQVWITREVYGIGDMLEYWRSGVMVATALRYDFGSIAPEVMKLLFRSEDVRLPFEIFAGSPATGSMLAMTSWILYVVGDSLYATALVISFAAFLGKLAIYAALRGSFPRALHGRLLVGCTLVPSVVYWSSGILKESVAIAGIGAMCLALPRIAARRWTAAALLLAIGTLLVALVKPYILFSFVLAAAVWLYWTNRVARVDTPAVKPVYLGLGAAVAVFGIVGLGQVFPNYAYDRIGERTGQLQGLGEYVGGGSYYTLSDEPPSTLSGQLAYAPLALGTALFRPVLFEARKPQMLANALETTILMLLFLHAVFQRSWKWIKDTLYASPMLMFCLVFSMTLAVAVGLASTNLGTLSRYRMPLVPFFAVLLLVLSAPHPSPAAKPASDAALPRERAA